MRRSSPCSASAAACAVCHGPHPRGQLPCPGAVHGGRPSRAAGAWQAPGHLPARSGRNRKIRSRARAPHCPSAQPRPHRRQSTGPLFPRHFGQPGGRLNHCGTMAHRRGTKQRPIFDSRVELVDFRSAGTAAQRGQANRCNERTAPPRASPRGARPFRFVQLLRSWVWGSRRCLLRERSKSMALHRRQGRRARAAAWWHRSERRG